MYSEEYFFTTLHSNIFLYLTVKKVMSKINKQNYYEDDPFWLENPRILIEKPAEFYPLDSMMTNEKLNSYVRLTFYIGVTLSLYNNDVFYSSVLFIALFLTLAMYRHSKNSTEKELFSLKPRRKPTKDNPFMNFNPITAVDDPSEYEKEAADITNEDVAEEANTFLQGEHLTATENVFGNQFLERQFITNPGTGPCSDLDQFKDWLYGDMRSCKSDPYDCQE